MPLSQNEYQQRQEAMLARQIQLEQAKRSMSNAAPEDRIQEAEKNFYGTLSQASMISPKQYFQDTPGINIQTASPLVGKAYLMGHKSQYVGDANPLPGIGAELGLLSAYQGAMESNKAFVRADDVLDQDRVSMMQELDGYNKRLDLEPEKDGIAGYRDMHRKIKNTVAEYQNSQTRAARIRSKSERDEYMSRLEKMSNEGKLDQFSTMYLKQMADANFKGTQDLGEGRYSTYGMGTRDPAEYVDFVKKALDQTLHMKADAFGASGGNVVNMGDGRWEIHHSGGKTETVSRERVAAVALESLRNDAKTMAYLNQLADIERFNGVEDASPEKYLRAAVNAAVNQSAYTKQESEHRVSMQWEPAHVAKKREEEAAAKKPHEPALTTLQAGENKDGTNFIDGLVSNLRGTTTSNSMTGAINPAGLEETITIEESNGRHKNVYKIEINSQGKKFIFDKKEGVVFLDDFINKKVSSGASYELSGNNDARNQYNISLDNYEKFTPTTQSLMPSRLGEGSIFGNNTQSSSNVQQQGSFGVLRSDSNQSDSTYERAQATRNQLNKGVFDSFSSSNDEFTNRVNAASAARQYLQAQNIDPNTYTESGLIRMGQDINKQYQGKEDVLNFQLRSGIPGANIQLAETMLKMSNMGVLQPQEIVSLVGMIKGGDEVMARNKIERLWAERKGTLQQSTLAVRATEANQANFRREMESAPVAYTSDGRVIKDYDPKKYTEQNRVMRTINGEDGIYIQAKKNGAEDIVYFKVSEASQALFLPQFQPFLNHTDQFKQFNYKIGTDEIGLVQIPLGATESKEPLAAVQIPGVTNNKGQINRNSLVSDVSSLLSGRQTNIDVDMLANPQNAQRIINSPMFNEIATNFIQSQSGNYNYNPTPQEIQAKKNELAQTYMQMASLYMQQVGDQASLVPILTAVGDNFSFTYNQQQAIRLMENVAVGKDTGQIRYRNVKDYNTDSPIR